MPHPDDPRSDSTPTPDPPVSFSRRTAFRFAAGAAGVAAVTAAGAATANATADPADGGPECMADLTEGK